MNKIDNEKIVTILSKVLLEEVVSIEEQKTLDDWRSASGLHQQMFDEVMDEKRWKTDLKFFMGHDDQAIWNKIAPRIEDGGEVAKVVTIRKAWFNYAAAAFVGIALLTGAYWFTTLSRKEGGTGGNVAVLPRAQFSVDENRAFLKLSDGSIIYLDDAVKNVELAREGASKIVKLTDGEISYDAVRISQTDQQPLTINILSIPKGDQYKLTLPDGSKVWLNAASSLRFPTAFNEKERSVELNGEAYFEIAPTLLSSAKGRNSRIPFHVKVNGVNVEVLGTRFNVMAYANEPEIKTTLLEGAVRISAGADACLLKPGQEASVITNTKLDETYQKIRVSEVNSDNAIDWKNGLIQFKGADVDNVMRKISRWYGITVVYEGDKPQGKYTGKIDLNTSLAEVVAVLKFSGIQSRLEGDRMMVFSE